ncbi:MAG: hypothetical protein WD333_01080 [Dehalococcoidia bacterium]
MTKRLQLSGHNRLVPLTITALALALIVSFAGTTSPAQALSCVQFSTSEYIERADIVLVGTVQSFDESHSDGQLFPGQEPRAEVAVERYLKGSGPGTVTVRSPNMPWYGGWAEENVGQEWLFYLTRGEGNEYVDEICSGSRPSDDSHSPASLEEVEAVTGPGVAPESGADAPTDEATANPETAPEDTEPENPGAPRTTFYLSAGVAVAGLLMIGGATTVLYVRRR